MSPPWRAIGSGFRVSVACFFTFNISMTPQSRFFLLLPIFNGFYASNHYVFIQHLVCSTCFFCDVDTAGMWTYIAKPLIFCGLNFLEFLEPNKKKAGVASRKFPPTFLRDQLSSEEHTWLNSWLVNLPPWEMKPWPYWENSYGGFICHGGTLHGGRLSGHHELPPIYIGMILNFKPW